MKFSLHGRLRYSGLCGLAAITVCAPLAAQNQEITAFKLTGVEGNVSLRYTSDELVTVSGGSKSREFRPTFEEELNILTHSYVYHPNFLKIDLGGGPLIVQSRLKTDSGENRSEDTLYNLTGRFSFLENKPYPFVFYYEHLNPSVSLGIADRFLQTNTRAGVNASLLQPVLPVSVNLDVFRLDSEGKGLGVILDETTDVATLRAYRALGDSGHAQLAYNTNHRESRSGSPNLPIQASTTDSHNVSFDSRNIFGGQRQFQFTQLASYSAQDFVISGTPFTSYRDIRFSPDLRWEHNPDRNSFYRYNFFGSDQGSQETRNHSAIMGLTQRVSKNFTATGDLHGENNHTTGIDQDNRGVAASINYRQPFKNGSWLVSYGIRYDDRDRIASVNQIDVLGERITLPNSIAVSLSNDFIIASTVVVSNLARSQTYVLNVDYELVVIGSRTSVRRLIGGAILDGQEVLVDYSFQTGGTFRYTSQDQTLQSTLILYRYYQVFAGVRDAPQKLVSGNPTLSLNSISNTHYGVRVGLPLDGFAEVGGEARHEKQDEDIAPYTRDNIDVYLQFPLPFTRTATLRIAGRRALTDNIGSPEDVDLKGWTLRWTARPWSRSVMSAEFNYDDDIGGVIRRRHWSTVILAEWRIRQLTLRAEGRQSRELQGSFERERNLIQLLARRDF